MRNFADSSKTEVSSIARRAVARTKAKLNLIRHRNANYGSLRAIGGRKEAVNKGQIGVLIVREGTSAGPIPEKTKGHLKRAQIRRTVK